jgi:hypothetical protein
MTTGWVYLAGLLATFSTGTENAPLAWSSESDWLAYRAVSHTPGGVPEPGWLFHASSRDRARPLRLEGESGRPPRYRIVASERAGGHLLIADGVRALTSPCWDRLRGELLFGRLGESEEGESPRLVIARRGFDPEPVVLGALPLEGAPERWAEARLEASSDGRYLAVSRPWIPDVVILRADNGRTLKTIPSATLPVWSRDGGRLAYLSGGASPWLHVLDASFGPPTTVVGPLAPVPPQWSRDGDTVFVVLSRKLAPPAIRGESLELVRVTLDSRAAETVTKLGLSRIDPTAPAASVSFTLGHDDEDLFHALSGVPGQPTSIVWFRPKTGETVSRFHPLDVSVGVSDLVLSPDGKTLAGRYGPERLVGLSDPGNGDLRPVVPDEESRLEWVRLLVETGTSHDDPRARRDREERGTREPTPTSREDRAAALPARGWGTVADGALP